MADPDVEPDAEGGSRHHLARDRLADDQSVPDLRPTEPGGFGAQSGNRARISSPQSIRTSPRDPQCPA